MYSTKNNFGKCTIERKKEGRGQISIKISSHGNDWTIEGEESEILKTVFRKVRKMNHGYKWLILKGLDIDQYGEIIKEALQKTPNLEELTLDECAENEDETKRGMNVVASAVKNHGALKKLYMISQFVGEKGGKAWAKCLGNEGTLQDRVPPIVKTIFH